MRMTGETSAVIRSERGVALPMALFTLLLLTSLSIAFLTLGQSEPVIGNNQLRSAQARVLAEAGVERAVWAMSNITDSGLTASSKYANGMPANGVVASSPYDGLSCLTGGGTNVMTSTTGCFTVKITGGADQYTMTVDAEGWTPTTGRSTVTGYDSTDVRTKSHRKINVSVIRYPEYDLLANCALCVNGDLVVRGSSVISSTADRTCGNKYGVATAGALCLGGASACDPTDSQWGNSGSINGATDTNTLPNQPADYQRLAGSSGFDKMKLSAAQLDALRQQAKDQGTYYSGSLTTFDSNNKVPATAAIVFVDGNVKMTGNPYAGDSFNGWMIVIGSATVNGNGTLNGLLYTTDDITSSVGTNVINGLVVSQNTTNLNGVDSEASGNMTINFNCANAKGSQKVPQQWFPKKGSWTEPSG